MNFRDKRRMTCDEGVSPVVGMIMVLGVSVVGIAAVLYWGLPAIDDMKANVEFKSLESQMKELNADVRELVAGTAGKTSKRWQPSMSRGELAVETSSQRWAMLVNVDRTDAAYYDFYLHGWDGSTANLTLRYEGTRTLGATAYLQPFKLTQDTETPLGACNARKKACEYPSIAGLASGTEVQFSLTEDAVAFTELSLTNTTVRIDVWDDTQLAAQIWIMDLGAVHYHVAAASSDRHIYLANGALVSDINGNRVVMTSPPIPPPSSYAGVPRVFMRAIHVSGDASFAGSARFEMQLNLYATNPRADYTCKAADGPKCVDRARVYIAGDLADTFKAYFTQQMYGFEAKTKQVRGLDTDFIQYPPDAVGRKPMAFTLVQSIIVAGVS